MFTVRIRHRLGVSVTAAALLVPLGVLASSPATAAASCQSHVTSDFNGDGISDLAIGADDADDVGSVQVDYGSSSGIDPARTQLITPTMAGMPEPSASYEGFGTAVTSGNFNGDCYADLAVGSRYFTDSSHTDTGEVTILYGSATGLHPAGATQIFGPATQSDFGRSMTSGDFNRDGFDDLVVGAPNEGGDPGRVGIVYGDASGIHGTPTFLSLGASDSGFGGALAAGDFDGDGYADLAIGDPGYKDGTARFAGRIVIERGSSTGLSAATSISITQNTAGIPGVSERGDLFGASLAAGDINGDGTADLIVGVPGESIGSISQAGDIAYLPGSPSGITGAGAARFSLHTPGIPGVAKTAASAGFAVAVGDVNRDGFADIVFGLPDDEIGTIRGGTAVVMNGSASGPQVSGSKILSQVTAGISGKPEANDEFGFALAVVALDGSGPADVVIGAPGEVSPTHSGYAVIIPNVPGQGVTGSGSSTIPQASTTITNFGASFA